MISVRSDIQDDHRYFGEYQGCCEEFDDVVSHHQGNDGVKVVWGNIAGFYLIIRLWTEAGKVNMVIDYCPSCGKKIIIKKIK